LKKEDLYAWSGWGEVFDNLLASIEKSKENNADSRLGLASQHRPEGLPVLLERSGHRRFMVAVTPNYRHCHVGPVMAKSLTSISRAKRAMLQKLKEAGSQLHLRSSVVDSAF
jgi:hypothetical protein